MYIQNSDTFQNVDVCVGCVCAAKAGFVPGQEGTLGGMEPSNSSQYALPYTQQKAIYLLFNTEVNQITAGCSQDRYAKQSFANKTHLTDVQIFLKAVKRVSFSIKSRIFSWLTVQAQCDWL